MNQLTFLQKIRNKIRVYGRDNKIFLDKKNKIKISKTKIVIKGSNNTLHINSGVKINGSFIEIVGNNCRITIGKNSIIGDGCYLSAKDESIHLIIGDECMLSRNAKLMTSDGHPIYQNGEIINSAKDITLGDKVWIADDVTILKGVEVGANSVIGIGSVLTKSVPAGSIAVGNPAKVVKESISWTH
ncbi:acyltransferase [Sulfurimonas crateris]|uniref:Acyltransferase n=1 Tax=Sulfurimonas crateris TaxID=2574727 RepID=A0A4U2Z5G9_9BACT|nr:acyltransferase [Sulfurimonas crateris]TKI69419.1 acyltransferase [Sulfurimonas crateris]